MGGKTGGANRFSLTFFATFLRQGKKVEKDPLRGRGALSRKKEQKRPLEGKGEKVKTKNKEPTIIQLKVSTDR